MEYKLTKWLINLVDLVISWTIIQEIQLTNELFTYGPLKFIFLNKLNIFYKIIREC